MPAISKMCEYCAMSFTPKAIQQRFCRPSCNQRNRYWKNLEESRKISREKRERYDGRRPKLPVSTESKMCEYCAMSFRPKLAWQRFCTAICASRSRSLRDSERIKERKRKDYWKDPQKSRKSNHCNYVAHREARYACNRAYIKAHPEAMNGYREKSRKAHPETIRASVSRRRARIKFAPINDLTAKEIKALLRASKGRCVYCGKKVRKLTLDHITPITTSGNHTLSNIVIACFACNRKKHTHEPLTPVQPYLLIV